MADSKDPKEKKGIFSCGTSSFEAMVRKYAKAKKATPPKKGLQKPFSDFKDK